MVERIIIPGGNLDPHVHFRQPGATHKEDFVSGTRAMVVGGYTAVLDMPNNPIPTTTPKALTEKRQLAEGVIWGDLGFNFGATVESSKYFKDVYKRVRALKQYMNPTTGITHVPDDEELEAIWKAWPVGKPIIVHAEGPTFERALKMQEKTGQRIHLAHLSQASELRMVMDAKNRGLPVTCEVSAHHLFLTDKDADTLPVGQGRMKPPLSSSKDVEFLRKNIAAIDIMASDHAPHTKEEKDQFTVKDGPYGVVGIELTIPLMLTAVDQGWVPLDKVVDMVSTRPRKIFGITADPLTYVQVEHGVDEYRVRASEFESKAKQTPFEGYRLTGRVLNVDIRAHQVVKNGEIVGDPVGRVI